MNQEELMERLRNPKKFQKQHQQQVTEENSPQQQAQSKNPTHKNRFPLIVGGGVFGLVLISLLFILSSQHKAENVSNALDPNALKGLVVDHTFSPKGDRKYVQISEGADRNVTLTGNYASYSLPVISRYNFRSFTARNYEVIGAAPWALSINVEANIADPELLRYLFNQQKVIDHFLKRTDVQPLLDSEKTLAEMAANEEALKSFFADKTVQQVLQDEKVLSALAGSRLFSYLLISKAVKYYRDHPAQAVKLIQASPTLTSLKQNPNVRKVVQENTYLKNIAPTLLK